MTTEQKAKAYDEALEKAKKWYDSNTNEGYRGIFEEILPELAESEDEKIRKELIGFLRNVPNSHYTTEKMAAWLEKQKPVKWSQEDLICLGYLADFVDKNGDAFYGKNKANVVKWIRSFAELSSHKHINEVEQEPVEWSKEDEEKINKLLQFVENVEDFQGIPNHFTEYKNMLKSLRPQKQQCFIATEEELAAAKKDAFNDALDKIEYHSGEPTFEYGWYAALNYIRQKQWKPSKEQLDALKRIKAAIAGEGVLYNPLNSLYEQLKAL